MSTRPINAGANAGTDNTGFHLPQESASSGACVAASVDSYTTSHGNPCSVPFSGLGMALTLLADNSPHASPSSGGSRSRNNGEEEDTALGQPAASATPNIDDMDEVINRAIERSQRMQREAAAAKKAEEAAATKKAAKEAAGQPAASATPNIDDMDEVINRAIERSQRMQREAAAAKKTAEEAAAKKAAEEAAAKKAAEEAAAKKAAEEAAAKKTAEEAAAKKTAEEAAAKKTAEEAAAKKIAEEAAAKKTAEEAAAKKIAEEAAAKKTAEEAAAKKIAEEAATKKAAEEAAAKKTAEGAAAKKAAEEAAAKKTAEEAAAKKAAEEAAAKKIAEEAATKKAAAARSEAAQLSIRLDEGHKAPVHSTIFAPASISQLSNAVVYAAAEGYLYVKLATDKLRYLKIGPENGALSPVAEDDPPAEMERLGEIRLGKYVFGQMKGLAANYPSMVASVDKLKKLATTFDISAGRDFGYTSIRDVKGEQRVIANPATGKLYLFPQGSNCGYAINPEDGVLTKLNPDDLQKVIAAEVHKHPAGWITDGYYIAYDEKKDYGETPDLVANVWKLEEANFQGQERDEILKYARTKLTEAQWEEIGKPEDFQKLVARLRLYFPVLTDALRREHVREAIDQFSTKAVSYNPATVFSVNTKKDEHYYVEADPSLDTKTVLLSGEKQIFGLVDTAKVEEAWIYVEFEQGDKPYKRWYECGINGREDGAQIDYFIIPRLMLSGAKIGLVQTYHIHPGAIKEYNPDRLSGIDINEFAEIQIDLAELYHYTGSCKHSILTPAGSFDVAIDQKHTNLPGLLRTALSKIAENERAAPETFPKLLSNEALRVHFTRREVEPPPPPIPGPDIAPLVPAVELPDGGIGPQPELTPPTVGPQSSPDAGFAPDAGPEPPIPELVAPDAGQAPDAGFAPDVGPEPPIPELVAPDAAPPPPPPPPSKPAEPQIPLRHVTLTDENYLKEWKMPMRIIVTSFYDNNKFRLELNKMSPPEEEYEDGRKVTGGIAIINWLDPKGRAFARRLRLSPPSPLVLHESWVLNGPPSGVVGSKREHNIDRNTIDVLTATHGEKPDEYGFFYADDTNMAGLLKEDLTGSIIVVADLENEEMFAEATRVARQLGLEKALSGKNRRHIFIQHSEGHRSTLALAGLNIMRPFDAKEVGVFEVKKRMDKAGWSTAGYTPLGFSEVTNGSEADKYIRGENGNVLLLVGATEGSAYPATDALMAILPSKIKGGWRPAGFSIQKLVFIDAPYMPKIFPGDPGKKGLIDSYRENGSLPQIFLFRPKKKGGGKTVTLYDFAADLSVQPAKKAAEETEKAFTITGVTDAEKEEKRKAAEAALVKSLVQERAREGEERRKRAETNGTQTALASSETFITTYRASNPGDIDNFGKISAGAIIFISGDSKQHGPKIAKWKQTAIRPGVYSPKVPIHFLDTNGGDIRDIYDTLRFRGSPLLAGGFYALKCSASGLTPSKESNTPRCDVARKAHVRMPKYTVPTECAAPPKWECEDYNP